MDHSHSERLLAHCPLCHAAYDGSHVRLVGERGLTRLFHCRCAECGQSIIAVVSESQGNVSSLGLVTDLALSDAMRFASAEPISGDECIAIHNAIDTDSRGFVEWFRESR